MSSKTIKSDTLKVTKVHRRLGTQKLRKIALEKHGYKCAHCGITHEEVPLELAFIEPISQGGQVSEENCLILCPNCHRNFDQSKPIHEIEFINFLEHLLSEHPEYLNIKSEMKIGQGKHYRLDLYAEKGRGNNKETLLIECKASTRIDRSYIHGAVQQIKKYQEAMNGGRMILAMPISLNDKYAQIITKENIELWDLPALANKFEKQVSNSPSGRLKHLILAKANRQGQPSEGERLISELKKCPTGRPDWSVYQQLVGSILEYLFTPPLNKPIAERSDQSKTNRRDFILPNYAEDGFWYFLREKYTADYIVVDAKNYSSTVQKNSVLQVANYLKPHGAGYFGIIISRKGGDKKGFQQTIREQWLIHKKLILDLNDEDVIAMLQAKSDGHNPEDILAQKIEDFRLSM